MEFLKRNSFKILLSLLFLFHLFIYKDFFLKNKIVFPSNFLVQFYSPWSTQIFPNWEQGIPHKPIGVDQFRFFYPVRSFINESFQNREFPLWNPYIFSGNPVTADFQSAAFYPLSIIYLFIPQITAWSILIIIEPLLAVLGMYLFLKKINIENLSAFLGAIAFGYSGFMTVWGQENMVVPHAALWLPFILWALEEFLTSGKYRYLLLTVLFLTFSFLAGFFQLTFYIFIFIFIYGLFRIINLKTKLFLNFFLLFVIFFLTLLLSSIQFLPSLEGFFRSPRTTSGVWYLFETYLVPITHLVNIYIPDIFGNPGAYNFFGRGFYHETLIYIGVIPLIFAIFNIAKRKKNFPEKFFFYSAIFTFLLTVSSPFTTFFYKLPLPLISTFQPSRILLITTFSLSVLSALGFNFFLKKKKIPKNLIFISLSLIALSLISILFVFLLKSDLINQRISSYIIRPYFVWEEKYFSVFLKNILLQTGFVLIFIFLLVIYKLKNIFVFLVIFFALIGQFYFLQKYVVIGEKEFLYPPNPILSFLKKNSNDTNRFIALGKPIAGNFSTLDKIYSPDGLDPIFSNEYGQLVYAATHKGKFTYNIPRIEVSLSNIDNKTFFKDNFFYWKLINLLGVKYVLYYSDPEDEVLNTKFPSDFFNKIGNISNWNIYENKMVLPRVYLTYDYKIIADREKIIKAVLDPSINLRKTTILEKMPFKSLKEGTGSAKLLSYSPQKVIIRTSTNNEALLFLSDTYYKGWNAYIDSSKTEILRANSAFRGVFVPAGDHIITFKYEPFLFRLGLILTLYSSFLFVFGVILLLKIKKL